MKASHSHESKCGPRSRCFASAALALVMCCCSDSVPISTVQIERPAGGEEIPKEATNPSEVKADAPSADAEAMPLAIDKGDSATLQVLLARGVSPNMRLPNGESALYRAVRDGQSAAASLLLEYGAIVPRQDGPMGNVLSLAVQHRDKELTEQLLRAGAEPNVAHFDGLTPLGLALQVKDLALAELILQHGGDATMFFNAAFDSGDDALMDLLCKHGAGVNNPDATGETLLTRAVRAKNLVSARFLADRGADPQGLSREGQSAFSLAVATRQVEMASLFLEKGANANAPFLSPPKPEFLALIDNDGFRRWLEKDSLFTPLMLAAARGDVEMIGLLLRHGAKRGSQSKNWRRYPINFACEQAHIPAAQVLLGRDPTEPRDVYAVISLSQQKAWIYRDGEMVRTSKVSTGRKGFATPSGRYLITDKQVDWNSSIYKVPMPYFMRLSCKDIGMHAGVVSGGRPASHGCIRLPRGEAVAFYGLMKVGDPVTIEE